MQKLDYHSLPETPELDVVRVVSLLGDRVLLVKEADDPNWKLPGGKIHPGETVFQALQREVKEELGLQVTEADILRYIAAPIPDSHNIRHIFLITPISRSVVVKTSEVEETAYFSQKVLPATQFKEHIYSAIRLLQA